MRKFQKEMQRKKEECQKLWETTDLTGEEIAKKVGVSLSTFWRWKKEGDWKRNYSSNTNPPRDDSEKTKGDEISIEFKAISLNQYNDLLYAIQMDNTLSRESKGLAIEILPKLIDNTKLFISLRIPFDVNLQFLNSECWKELMEASYITEHQNNSNITNGRKIYEFKILNTVTELEEKLQEKDREIEKLNTKLKRCKELRDLFDQYGCLC